MYVPSFKGSEARLSSSALRPRSAPAGPCRRTRQLELRPRQLRDGRVGRRPRQLQHQLAVGREGEDGLRGRVHNCGQDRAQGEVGLVLKWALFHYTGFFAHSSALQWQGPPQWQGAQQAPHPSAPGR